MVAVHRRSFLGRLALGAGAAVLAPIARMLVSEAQGAPLDRKRLLIVLQGNGMNYRHFVPTELRNVVPWNDAEYAQRNTPTGLVVKGASDFKLPPMLTNLEPFKNRLLMLDGLANVQFDAALHSTGYCALSCVPPTSLKDLTGGSGDNTPGGASFDQHLAGKIGSGYTFKSIGLAALGTSATVVPTCSASGRDQPVPVLNSAKEAVARLFGGGQPAGGGTDLLREKRRRLFDYLRDDIKRVQANLAGAERTKLDEYLSSIDTIDKRLASLAATRATSCQAPAPAAGATSEERAAAQIEIATAALACGLTPVALVLSHTGNFFNTQSWGPFPGVLTHTMGHGEGPGWVGLDKIHNLHAGYVARAAQRLQSIQEGNGTALDNTVIVYSNDNGGAHHKGHGRWPVVLMGGGGGKLATDGRYIKYPMGNIYGGQRGLGELFRTIEQIFTGAPSTFAEQSKSPVKGPLTEVLA